MQEIYKKKTSREHILERANNADGSKGDCDNLPEKYNFYWGE